MQEEACVREPVKYAQRSQSVSQAGGLARRAGSAAGLEKAGRPRKARRSRQTEKEKEWEQREVRRTRVA